MAPKREERSGERGGEQVGRKGKNLFFGFSSLRTPNSVPTSRNCALRLWFEGSFNVGGRFLRTVIVKPQHVPAKFFGSHNVGPGIIDQ